MATKQTQLKGTAARALRAIDMQKPVASACFATWLWIRRRELDSMRFLKLVEVPKFMGPRIDCITLGLSTLLGQIFKFLTVKCSVIT